MAAKRFTLSHFREKIEEQQLDEEELEEYEKKFPLYDSIIQGVTHPQTFAQLYLLHCLKIHDLPEHYDMYADADNGMKLVKSNLEAYKKALDDSRISIVVPMDIMEQNHQFNKEYYDDITDDDIPVYMSSPPTDDLRIALINKMEGPPEVVKWKVDRIAKVLRIGWDSFVQGYG